MTKLVNRGMPCAMIGAYAWANQLCSGESDADFPSDHALYVVVEA